MPTYLGTVKAPNAQGPLMISLPNTPGGNVTGNLKIGALPRQALTGFSGKMTGVDTFEAKGANTRGQGLDQMHLVVAISGYRTAGGEHVAGTITAILNGQEQPGWTFQAGLPGTEELQVAEDATGQLVYIEPEPPTLWEKVQTPLKVLGGLGVAVGAAIFIKRKLIG